ncbi:MAG: FliM/FliN family flagellar motor switch protein [Pirellulaceae bacterium]
MSEKQTPGDVPEEVNEPANETVTTETQAVETKTPEYAPVTDTSAANSDRSINRFLDVEVTISAELGRVTIPIGELVELGEGSVVELNRSISAPVDLMAQGLRVATGEVVVIDDCFAVRIKSIESVETGSH